jgi:hypothetical protein
MRRHLHTYTLWNYRAVRENIRRKTKEWKAYEIDSEEYEQRKSISNFSGKLHDATYRPHEWLLGKNMKKKTDLVQ